MNNADKQKIENLLNSWKFVVKRAKAENGITGPWSDHQSSFCQGLSIAIHDLQKFYDEAIASCKYNKDGEGYTAPNCLEAGEHVEGCQYFEFDLV